MLEPVMSCAWPYPVARSKLFDEPQSLEVGPTKAGINGLIKYGEAATCVSIKVHIFGWKGTGNAEIVSKKVGEEKSSVL